MSDDFLYRCGQERQRDKSSENNSKDCLEKGENCNERSPENGFPGSHDDNNSKTFETNPKFPYQELSDFKNTALRKQNCEITHCNANLSLRQKLRLGSVFVSNSDDTVIKHIMDTERTSKTESLGKFSFPTRRLNGALRRRETTDITANTRYSEIHGKCNSQRKKERKSSLRNSTVLPPLAEERHDRPADNSPSISAVRRRHTIGDFKERNGFEVPSVVLSKGDDEARDTNILKLPKIEAVNTKSRYLQVPLSSPEPNRLAPPVFLEPFKAHRPPAKGQLEDNGDSEVDVVRLPELRTRSSSISITDKNDEGVKQTSRICWTAPDHLCDK